jgi:hypothetical protein
LQRLPPVLVLKQSSLGRPRISRVNAPFAIVDDLRSTPSFEPCIQVFFKDSNPSKCFVLIHIICLSAVLPDRQRNQITPELRRRMLIFLATRALERINELRTRHSDPQEQQWQLQSQLQALRGRAQCYTDAVVATD